MFFLNGSFFLTARRWAILSYELWEKLKWCIHVYGNYYDPVSCVQKSAPTIVIICHVKKLKSFLTFFYNHDRFQKLFSSAEFSWNKKISCPTAGCCRCVIWKFVDREINFNIRYMNGKSQYYNNNPLIIVVASGQIFSDQRKSIEKSSRAAAICHLLTLCDFCG